MRTRFLVLLCFLSLTASLSAKDIYLSICGKAGSFRTDARIINPSYDKDIVIQARYLPFGNVDNRGLLIWRYLTTKDGGFHRAHWSRCYGKCAS